jgi:predicted nucleic acid-binding protein
LAFVVVYDANVLYPFHLRDLLIRLAGRDLFQAKWTDDILDEVFDSLLRNRPDLDSARLERTRQLMCEAVRDCLVSGYEPLIESIETPDPDDRHVIAAAVRCHAQVIVTNDSTGFPAETLSLYGIEAQTADEFVSHCVDLDPNGFVDILQRMVEPFTDPPMDMLELIDALERDGLTASVESVHHLVWRRYN